MTSLTLHHNKVDLALHCLSRRAGPPLLFLHGLGEATPDSLPATLAAWPGPVWGLDFTGHGASTVPVGGGYTAEVLMADADHALAELGSCSLLGRGLGAYVALLLAGARPTEVRGTVLADGPGLNGAGIGPGAAVITVDPVDPGPPDTGPPDPFALAELSHDVRPGGYAAGFARQAVQRSGLDRALVVAAKARPAWLTAVLGEVGVEQATSVPAALTMVADQTF